MKGLISARSTLNVAALACIALLATLSMRGEVRPARAVSLPRGGWTLAASLVLLSTAASFLPGLDSSFLFDDYTHLTLLGDESLGSFLRRVLVIHPAGGDFFFRPLGDLVFRIISLWSGAHPASWHSSILLLHLANTGLVFLMCARAGAGPLGCSIGSLIFGWHGAHVESVCWMSALYDPLATFFVLLALWADARNSRSSYLFAILACLSKESAYCLPLLAFSFRLLLQPENLRLTLRKSAGLAAACGLVFAYRLWYLGGWGGYQSSGHALAVHVRLIGAVQALLLRIWGLLLVPVNWSIPPGLGLRVATTLLVLALAGVAINGRLKVQRLGAIACFTLSAALPVVSLLLIGSDLSGSRILYLPSAGFALLWAEIVEGIAVRKLAVSLSALILIFHLAALEHNEAIWGWVSRAAQQACWDAAAIVKREPGVTFAAADLPRTKDGVFFLQNGFRACIAINGSLDLTQVKVVDSPSATAALGPVLSWDDSLGRLVARPPTP